MSPSRSIHIVIADDHSVVREGLVAMIDREPDMQVVGQASNWPGAGEQAAAIRSWTYTCRGWSPVKEQRLCARSVPRRR